MAKRKETECAVGNRQDEEEILKTYQTEDYDYLANSATGMDCTGLMHRTPCLLYTSPSPRDTR